MSDDWMVIGTAVGAFGVRGEVKVELHTDFPDRFKGLKTVYLGARHLPFEVEGARKHMSQVLLRLQGIDTPEAVSKLRGQEIAVPRTEAVSLPKGHYYLDEAIGLQVVTSDGRELGAVTDVVRTGSNDVFVVNEGKAAVLIPVIKDAVTELDLINRRVTVEPWVLNVEE